MMQSKAYRMKFVGRATAALLVVWSSSFAWGVEPLKVGDMAPDALGKDPAGVPVTVSEYRGKVVVVSFWASWCTPCRRELNTLEGLQRVGGPKGVQVIAVNWKEDPRIISEFKKAMPDLQMRLASDSKGTAGNKYGIEALPQMFILDKEGKVSFISVGYGDSVVDEVVEQANRALRTKSPDVSETAPASPSAL